MGSLVPLRGAAFVRLAATALWLASLAAPARAIPSHTPHTHNNPGTVDHDTTWINPTPPPEQIPDPDPDNPDAKMHQHRDTDALTGGNGKYIANKVWDDRDYHVGGEFGHGFIDIAPRYLFDGAFPGAGVTDFNGAVGEWMRDVNGAELNTNGVPIRIHIAYQQVTAGAHEIDVFWRDIGAADDFATAFWDPAATDFTFDSNPTVGLAASPGTQIRLPGDPNFHDSIQLPDTWFFGGSGTPGTVTDAYQVFDGTNVIDKTIDIEQYDFFTIALHEIGHSWGLAHFGTGIMRTDISSFVMRTPDAGSIDGVKDLYAIPAPEPGAFAFLLCGGGASWLGVLRFRRR